MRRAASDFYFFNNSAVFLFAFHSRHLIDTVHFLVFALPAESVAVIYIRTSSGSYRFFENDPTHETILTTDPTLVAYADIKMVPFYNNVDDAVSIYTQYKNQADIIVYTSEFYPCFNEICRDKRSHLFKEINATSELIFHKKYDQDYFIYTKP